jgi:hypothetical protein
MRYSSQGFLHKSDLYCYVKKFNEFYGWGPYIYLYSISANFFSAIDDNTKKYKMEDNTTGESTYQ